MFSLHSGFGEALKVLLIEDANVKAITNEEQYTRNYRSISVYIVFTYILFSMTFTLKN